MLLSVLLRGSKGNSNTQHFGECENQTKQLYWFMKYNLHVCGARTVGVQESFTKSLYMQ
jgi:hypothetical protein